MSVDSARPPARGRPPSAARHLPMLKQFLKFGIVGISNTLLSLLIYTVLVKVFGVWYLAASTIAFAIGAVNGYLLNRGWTFRGHAVHGHAVTAVRWGVVQGCGLLVNDLLVFLFVSQVGLGKLLGQVCATAIVVVLTFFANRAWTFAPRPADEHGVAPRVATPRAGAQ